MLNICLNKRINILPIFMISFLLCSCSTFIREQDAPAGNHLLVSGPQSGRDIALDYVQNHYDPALPSGSVNWVEKNITPDGITTSEVYEFSQDDWLVSVIYRVVEPSERIYRISITNHYSFTWDGQVDSLGQVTEYRVVNNPEAMESVPTPSPAIALLETDTPTPSPDIGVSSKIYSDETYRLGFVYPSSWSLSTLPAGRNVGDKFAPKTIELTRDDMKFSIQYKFLWERTEIGEEIPSGKIEIRRRVSLLGIEIPVIYVVVNGYDNYIFLDGEKDDLAFGFYLSTNRDEIPAEIQDEVDLILASIMRTGDPLPTPTVPPTALPTSAIAARRSGSGSGSTVSEDCNRAKFIAHVTVPEGTLMLPGVQFTKIWRLQNTGTCTWTTDYSLVYSTGDLMGAEKRVKMPKPVLPGEMVDISVDFTSPEKVGQYQGYWILNDPQGYWFGLGDLKNGFIPIDIIVFLPSEEYAYDLAIHYCDAVWTSESLEKDQELPCPGSPSSNGFVILVADPYLENRHEDELALWVHPNEERYGWIRGKYPSYTVQNGDHFRGWVSCLAEMNLCSLQFSLSYADSNGDVHPLGNWIETYDGKITEIDLDLSTLTGQSIRLILRTEALTKNISAAQGYWFVPRIENP